MVQSFTELAKQHWVLGGIAASIIWFLAGQQSSANGKPGAAMGWISIGILVALVVFGWTIAEAEWLGSASSLLVLCFEVQSLRQIGVAYKRSAAHPSR
jgi:hypothetical protein